MTWCGLSTCFDTEFWRDEIVINSRAKYAAVHRYRGDFPDSVSHWGHKKMYRYRDNQLLQLDLSWFIF